MAEKKRGKRKGETTAEEIEAEKEDVHAQLKPKDHGQRYFDPLEEFLFRCTSFRNKLRFDGLAT